MLDSIKDWAFSICAASICGTMMNIILPKGDLQKIFKTVYSVFFLCCILSPINNYIFSGADIDFDFFNKDAGYEIPKSDIFANQNELLENEIKEKTKFFLEENDIKVKNISVKINILDEGSIEIDDFDISVISGDKENIKNIVMQEIGLVPEIIILGENENGEY